MKLFDPSTHQLRSLVLIFRLRGFNREELVCAAAHDVFRLPQPRVVDGRRPFFFLGPFSCLGIAAATATDHDIHVHACFIQWELTEAQTVDFQTLSEDAIGWETQALESIVDLVEAVVDDQREAFEPLHAQQEVNLRLLQKLDLAVQVEACDAVDLVETQVFEETAENPKSNLESVPEDKPVCVEWDKRAFSVDLATDQGEIQVDGFVGGFAGPVAARMTVFEGLRLGRIDVGGAEDSAVLGDVFVVFRAKADGCLRDSATCD